MQIIRDYLGSIVMNDGRYSVVKVLAPILYFTIFITAQFFKINAWHFIKLLSVSATTGYDFSGRVFGGTPAFSTVLCDCEEDPSR